MGIIYQKFPYLSPVLVFLKETVMKRQKLFFSAVNSFLIRLLDEITMLSSFKSFIRCIFSIKCFNANPLGVAIYSFKRNKVLNLNWLQIKNYWVHATYKSLVCGKRSISSWQSFFILCFNFLLLIVISTGKGVCFYAPLRHHICLTLCGTVKIKKEKS